MSFSDIMKSTSLAAIVAGAALLATGSNARAADLGGNCCADLEERIAELEATTVRKGNRKVSLTISGYVSHHVMWWDDGVQNDVYIGDGGNYGSRWRFVGSAKITPQVTAGFLYEWAANTNSIGSMNQANGGDDLGNSGAPNTLAGYAGCGQNGGSAGTIGCQAVRDSTVWLRHEQLGMIKVGHGSTATDNLVLIDLGNMVGASTPDIGLYNGGMFPRNPVASMGVGVVPITWSQMILGGQESWDTNRRNHVMYETPTLHGFSIQAAYGEDNYWDIALRYAGEFGGFRIAAGIGYREDTKFNGTFQLLNTAGVLCSTQCERRQTALLGSASVLHVQSGLFLTGAAGRREDHNFLVLIGSTDNRNSDADFWYLAGGLSKNLTGLGNTVLYGEYSEHNDALRFVFSDVTGSQVTHWGLGIVQHIDAAAMEIFLAYKHFDAEFTRNNGTLAAPIIERVTYDAYQTLILGTRINF